MAAHVNRHLGRLLRHFRVDRRLTQQQLAKESGVSIRTIRDIERGDSQQPRRETVRLMATALALSSAELTELEAASGRSATRDDLKLAFESAPLAPPSPIDALIGRHAEVAALTASLRMGSQRLVTITGIGGVGKTRLVLEVAGRLHEADGVAVLWASSDSLYPTEPRASEQLSSVLRSGIDGLLGSTEGGCAELDGVIVGHPTLLVLDGQRANRLRVDRIMTLLRDCAGMRVVITSSGPLDLHGERVFPLAPLAVPEHARAADLAGLVRVPSVELLTRYVRQVRPGFRLTDENAHAVVELARWADGIPAALEAVASWFTVYEPAALCEQVDADPFAFIEGLRERLDERLGALAGGERFLLGRLSDLERTWTVAEAATASGLPPTACARSVRKLLAQGVVRPAGSADRSRFRVLNLVRCLRSGRPVGVGAA